MILKGFKCFLGGCSCVGKYQQSPIDLSSPIESKLSPVQFFYQDSALKLAHNKYTIEVDYDSGSYIKFSDQDYQLLQFHFHSPSEHTVAGKYFDMELHLVHQNSKGVLAVIGVFIKEGSFNADIQKVWDVKSQKQPDHTQRINAKHLLPVGHNYHHYMGSLTTKPYSEGLLWFVMHEVIEVSSEQIAFFKQSFKDNARSIQPTNGRFILSYSQEN